MKQGKISGLSPVKIDGVDYFAAADVHRAVGVARSTFWRWRSAAKVPKGRRHRDGRILYTEQELQLIRHFANRLEPLDAKADRASETRRNSVQGSQ